MDTSGESLQRRERGWPMPPAAPRTATLAEVGVDVEKHDLSVALLVERRAVSALVARRLTIIVVVVVVDWWLCSIVEQGVGLGKL